MISSTIFAIVLLIFFTSLLAKGQNDISCLREFKSSISDPSGHLSSWNFDNTSEGAVCSFTGINCWNPNENRILFITLSSFSLSGPIPSALRLCSSLTNLDLSVNDFSGPIPSSLCSWLPYLVTLDLSSNNLTGPIPPHLFNCQFLNSLILSGNYLSFGWVEEVDQATKFRHKVDVGRIRVSVLNGTKIPATVIAIFKGVSFKVGVGYEVKRFVPLVAPEASKVVPEVAVLRGPPAMRDSNVHGGVHSQLEEPPAPLDLKASNGLLEGRVGPNELDTSLPLKETGWYEGNQEVTFPSLKIDRVGRGGAGQSGQVQRLQHRAVCDAGLKISSTSEVAVSKGEKYGRDGTLDEKVGAGISESVQRSMQEAFVQFLRGDVSSLSSDQIDSWASLLRAYSYGPSKPSRELSIYGGPSSKSPELAIEEDFEAATLEVLPGGSRKRQFQSVDEGDSYISVQEYQSGADKASFDSPNDDDLIDALKDIEDTSPLSIAAKIWDIQTEDRVEDSPIRYGASRKGKEMAVEVPRRSSRQRERHGSRPLSKDDLIASAVKLKAPSSALEGIRKKVRTRIIFPSGDADPGFGNP